MKALCTCFASGTYCKARLAVAPLDLPVKLRTDPPRVSACLNICESGPTDRWKVSIAETLTVCLLSRRGQDIKVAV